MASEASTMATKPRVSIKPRASSCMGISLENECDARDARRRWCGQADVLELKFRCRNDMTGQELAHACGGARARRDRRLDFTQRATHRNRHQRIGGDFVAREPDVC